MASTLIKMSSNAFCFVQESALFKLCPSYIYTLTHVISHCVYIVYLSYGYLYESMNCECVFSAQGIHCMLFPTCFALILTCLSLDVLTEKLSHAKEDNLGMNQMLEQTLLELNNMWILLT